MGKERTQEQQDMIDKMDAAAAEAKGALASVDLKAAPATFVIEWWKTWYPKAGHKRLGRILAATK